MYFALSFIVIGLMILLKLDFESLCVLQKVNTDNFLNQITTDNLEKHK